MAFIAAIILFAGGIWLLKRGNWPKRVGQTPHCPGCNYILTGIQADRCPECGGPLRSTNIIYGERRRRPAVAGGAVLLLLISIAIVVAPLTDGWQQIQWYHYRPAAWVMGDLDSTSSAVKTKAWSELQRRLADGSLSVAQQNRLVERALREQQTGGGPAGYMSEMVDFLGQRYISHKLSAAQTEAFFNNALKLQLEVRRSVGRDDPVAIRISAIGRGPQTGWWMSESQSGYWVDEKKINQGTMSSAGGFGGHSSSTTCLQPQTPGKHRVRIEVEVGAGVGNFPNFNSPLDHPRTLELAADFEVAAGKLPIQWVTSPDAISLTMHLSASSFRINPGPFASLTGQIDAADPPVNLAFDVFARANGKEYPMGGVTFYQSTATPGSSHMASYQVTAQPLPPGDLQKIDIVLRSSERAAKQTVDLMTAWQGQIIIPAVTVLQPPTTRPAIPATQE
jgi:hypothetical protein